MIDCRHHTLFPYAVKIAVIELNYSKTLINSPTLAASCLLIQLYAISNVVASYYLQGDHWLHIYVHIYAQHCDQHTCYTDIKINVTIIMISLLCTFNDKISNHM